MKNANIYEFELTDPHGSGYNDKRYILAKTWDDAYYILDHITVAEDVVAAKRILVGVWTADELTHNPTKGD